MLSLLIKFITIYEILAAIAIIYNWWLKRKGLEGISYWDCQNPIKLFSVLIGFILMVVFPMHILEQYILRFYDQDCRRECLLGNNGNCVKCGCYTKAKMWSPLERDSQNRWVGIIWSRKKYEKLRKKYPLKIKIEFGGTI